MLDDHKKHLVAVVGAGPAGLYAARELAAQGVHVFLMNRDIKPGGLAEYGIYFDKYKMKQGLRAQFRQTLQNPEIEYIGNILVGEDSSVTLADLLSWGAEAVLVTAGAQGTKWLGIPGEDLVGVYHAKDIVYHYNQLPPFSQRTIHIGEKVAVIGVGNVMMDISHYLICEKKVKEVIALARRGPAETKFDRKELEGVEANLDLAAYDAEVDRVSAAMRAVNQDPEIARNFVHTSMEKAVPTGSTTHLTIRFLSSPVRILGDANGNVIGLEIEDNTLVADSNGSIKARSLGTRKILDVDTVIFAIGDRVDDHLGLPIQDSVFAKNPCPLYPVDDQSYEAFDPQTGQPISDVFEAGWSRNASSGLVGVARRDAVNGAQAILQHLQRKPGVTSQVISTYRENLLSAGKPAVTYPMIKQLELEEMRIAAEKGLEEFKFSTNQEMLEAMGIKQI